MNNFGVDYFRRFIIEICVDLKVIIMKMVFKNNNKEIVVLLKFKGSYFIIMVNLMIMLFKLLFS